MLCDRVTINPAFPLLGHSLHLNILCLSNIIWDFIWECSSQKSILLKFEILLKQRMSDDLSFNQLNYITDQMCRISWGKDLFKNQTKTKITMLQANYIDLFPLGISQFLECILYKNLQCRPPCPTTGLGRHTE